jgi:vacuolar iron transporter family protein
MLPERARRYAANRQAEVDSAALYHALAEAERAPEIAEVYRRLAGTEEQHASFWEERLRADGISVPARRPSWRARTLGLLARRLGPQVVLPIALGQERTGAADYMAQPESRDTGLPAQEQSHRRVLSAVAGASRSGLEGATLARLEGRHRAAGGNALRAAVLGANDGLVSNLSLVMGVVGAQLSSGGVLVTGLAGLLAGAGSMAMGEWLSVQSARELFERQIGIEREELAAAPAEEAEELRLIYRAKGLPDEQAKALAEQIVSNPSTALDTLAREELAIDPAELGGSAWVAAITSFVLFAIGAIIPVVPFFFATGSGAALASIAASAAALLGIGAAITLLTGRGVVYSALRQLLFGLAAAGLTYGIGTLIGTQIGG